jgi:hypothetical protein
MYLCKLCILHSTYITYNGGLSLHHSQNSPFQATAFLKIFCQICLELDQPVFASLDFATIFFYRARSSALRPSPNLEDHVSVFMSPSDKATQRQRSWLRHYATSLKVVCSFLMRPLDFFSWSNPSSSTMALGSTQLLTEISIMNLHGGKGKGRPARKTDNLTSICEPTVYRMWETRCLTALWTFTACYIDSFTFFTFQRMWFNYIPIRRVPFSSPSTARKAKMEGFSSASTRGVIKGKDIPITGHGGP